MCKIQYLPEAGPCRLCQIFCRYLKGKSEIGMLFCPKKNEALKLYAYADFAGNWLKEYTEFDPATAKSRSGWVITFVNCPILWASKMQLQLALSTTKAEYLVCPLH